MPPRNYVDFKLYLTAAPAGKGACQVALLPTPEVGEAISPVVVPAQQTPDWEQQMLLADKSITLGNLAKLGKQLGECLLPSGPIRDLFREAYRHAGEDRGVRLRLIIADHTLKTWPWEYAYVDLLGEGKDSLRGFLALDKRISFVRHEPLPFPHPAPIAAPAGTQELPLLIAAALTEGQEDLDLDAEIDTITTAVQGLSLAGTRIIPTVLRDATRAELAQALAAMGGGSGLPRSAGGGVIFHFAGHGAMGVLRDDFNGMVPKDAGQILLLADKHSKAEDRLSGDDLARHLKGAGVRLAVLGACHSGARQAAYPWDGVASALAASGIPAILAMQYEVLDEQAIAFSRAFYAALALGLSLDEATWSGRVAMLDSTSTDPEQPINVEWGVPVLYSRLADGALLPERIAASGSNPAAEAFRKVIDQTVTGIMDGAMIGVKVNLINNGVKVVQKVKTVGGKLTGVEAGKAGANANIVVEQEIETVGKDATVVAMQLDEL